MIAFALGIVAFAFASAAFTLKGQHPATIIEYIVAYSAIIVGAHLAVRKFAPFADPLLLPIVTLLNGLGLVDHRHRKAIAIRKARKGWRSLQRLPDSDDDKLTPKLPVRHPEPTTATSASIRSSSTRRRCGPEGHHGRV